ncbi:MAG: glycosyltransferase [Bacteroidales bacterium]|jgi:glycosyltransferase involved in cell wall biosynthesis|nr:glycosyltransferase [Bacteroidales bacterium]
MKILMILSRFPFPLEKGDKLRAFYHIKTLSEQHEVYLFCITSQNPTDEMMQALSPYCKEIRWFRPTKFEILLNIFRIVWTRKPVQNAFFVFKKAKQKLQKYIDDIRPDHLFFQLVRTVDYAEGNAHIPKTLDYQDAFSLGMLRRAEQAKFPMSRLFISEYRRLIFEEVMAFNKFEHKIIISETDRKFICHSMRNDISVVKNGVDLDFFKPDLSALKTADLLFVGNLSYPPNVRAMDFLVKEIMPKLVQKDPSVKLLIAGANPSKKRLKYQSENIQILANPKDIREAYNTAKIFVAPMMIGTGLQNKLLEAMAMRLPCITTPLANSGLRAAPNTEILIAETANEFVNQILYLKNNPDVCKQLSERAFEFVSQSFSWKKEVENWLNKIS